MTEIPTTLKAVNQTVLGLFLVGFVLEDRYLALQHVLKSAEMA